MVLLVHDKEAASTRGRCSQTEDKKMEKELADKGKNKNRKALGRMSLYRAHSIGTYRLWPDVMPGPRRTP